MQYGFRRSDVRPLAHEVRGQADREVLRQPERRKIELGQARLVRKLADQDRKLIAGLGEGLLERRQVRARLRKLRALREHVPTRESAESKLLLDQLQLAFLRIGDSARATDMVSRPSIAVWRGRASTRKTLAAV